jgi:hypothetical protein
VCSDGVCFDSCSSTRTCNDGALCASLDAFGDVLESAPSSPTPCRIGYRCRCVEHPAPGGDHRGTDAGAGSVDAGVSGMDAGSDASDASIDATPPRDASFDATHDADARTRVDSGEGGTPP